MRKTLLAFALLLPAAAGGQELRSGPNQPAVGGQIPPGALPSDRAGPPSDARPPRDTTERRAEDPGRTAPPPGHQTLGAPPVPGARQPERSEGAGGTPSPIPDRPGARPDASTTGQSGGGGGGANPPR
jgi:hypothetical protein